MIAYADTVDVYTHDDARTGGRMGRGQGKSLFAAALACRVNERSATGGDVFGREQIRHTHRVHFKNGWPGITTAHLLRWVPAEGPPVWMQVQAMRRPRAASMPWVCYAQAVEPGVTVT